MGSALEAAVCHLQEPPAADNCEQHGAAAAQQDVLKVLSEGVVWCEHCVDSLLSGLNVAGLPADVMLLLEGQGQAALAVLKKLRDDAKPAEEYSISEQLADMLESCLLQQLHSFAQAVVGRIPLSTACNNPGCVSLAQRSELLLVGGKSCVCGRCKAARYCCKACQVEHWKWHKALCKSKAQLAAAAAAAAPPPAAAAAAAQAAAAGD
uniref:phytol kinase n=1 Tax=Tetradesmus obliquus TaxID=3088 RepID=A0A383VU42_TETOB|eukprot:jgi/Sobl393_1/4520/SZX67916.1